MKKILYILFIIPLIALGQVPQGVNYQAVAYDSDGFELSNKEVGVRISIVEGSAFGTPQLVEKHDVVTTEQGLFSIIIGQGALLGGEVESLLDIPWGSNTFFLKIELDTENNGSYMDFGTQQFMSVPYALYAESSRELQENVDQNEINSYTADSVLQSQIIELQAELDVNESNLSDLIMSLQNSLDSINTPISNYHFSRTTSYSSGLDYSGSVSSIIDSIYIETGGLIFVSASMYASVARNTASASVSLGLQNVNGNAISLNSMQSFSTSVYEQNNPASSEKICIGNFVSENNQMIYIVGNYSCGGYNNYDGQGGNSGGFDVMLYR